MQAARIRKNPAIRRVAYCPHCGNRAPQRLLYRQRFQERTWSADGNEIDPVPWSTFVACCETCAHILVYDNPADQLDASNFSLGRLEYPRDDRLGASIPARVAEIYTEAARIKQIAPNAFAVQIRRALEAVCEHRNAKGSTLYERLKDLVARGEMPPVLAKATDILRLLGNIGAHSTSVSVHQLHVYAIDDFFRAVIEYLYVAPSKVKQFEVQLKTVRKSSIGRSKSKSS